MKHLTFSLLALSLASSVGNAAATSKNQFWVDEPEKTVLVAANPTLNVSIYKLEVSDEYYARMDVSLNYVGQDMVTQIKDITNAYTNYKIQKVILEKNGTYHYEIGVLGIAKDVDPKPGVEGPYIEDQIYLSRAKYKAAMTEIKGGRPLVHITGQVAGTVPMMKVIEHKELDGAVCGKLIGPEGTLSSTLTNMASASRSALSSIPFQYESTRDALIRDVKENCFDITPVGRVDSFADLLNIRVSARKLDRNLFGETLQKSYDKQDIPLSFDTKQSGGDN